MALRDPGGRMSAVLAFCGTGLMGAPMVRQLLAAGHRVRVWNRSPEKARALAADGAEPADTPADAADGSTGGFLLPTVRHAVQEPLFTSQGVHRDNGLGRVAHSRTALTTG